MAHLPCIPVSEETKKSGSCKGRFNFFIQELFSNGSEVEFASLRECEDSVRIGSLQAKAQDCSDDRSGMRDIASNAFNQLKSVEGSIKVHGREEGDATAGCVGFLRSEGDSDDGPPR